MNLQSCVALRAGDMEFYASVWPFWLEIWTLFFLRGSSSCGNGCPCGAVALQVGGMVSNISVRPLKV